MNTEAKVLGGILAGSLLLVLGFVFFLSKDSANPQGTLSDQSVTIDYSKGQKIGSESAKVKLVEFGDFQCPACKAAEPYVHQIRNDYGKDVQLIFRHFPLSQHQNARAAANFAAYAATQNKFWEVHDKLYESQDQWANLADPSNYFADLGKSLGLDTEKIKQAIQNSTFNAEINQDVDEGTKIGVSSTPTFYLNGQVVNIRNFAELPNTVAAELKK